MQFFRNTFLPYIKAMVIIAIPIILQQLFLNVASLLDTVMVGRLDSDSTIGVYVATQVIFVINLMIFGATEGGSVFFSQFFGVDDQRNMRKCFIFKLYFSIFFSALAIIFTNIFARNLAGCFTENQNALDIAVSYLRLLSISFIPYAIVSSISTSMREAHHTLFPMFSTGVGAICNFIINYIFIFGTAHIPALGAIGAAIGTISERYIEMILLIVYLIIRQYGFSKHLFTHLKIQKELLIKLLIRSFPLIINETLWSIGQILIVWIFTQNNSIATSTLPIASTIYNLFFVVVTGMSQSITILVGNTLGQGHMKDAQTKAYMSLIFALFVGLFLGAVLFFIAPWISSLYTGLSQNERDIGMLLTRIYAAYIVLCSITCSSFYIIRAGGRTVIVFLFDSGYTMLIQIPLASLLLKTTQLEFLAFVPAVYFIDIIKVIIGLIMIFSQKWTKSIIKEIPEDKEDEQISQTEHA